MDKRIYIAGPEVFNPKVDEIFMQIDKICVMAGFKAVFPQDKTLTTSKEIFEHCIELIDKCDYVIANLSPFRGSEPDSGTAFECAYAYSRGIPVFAYTSLNDTTDIPSARFVGGNWCDANGFLVESFGNKANVMLAESTKIVHGTFVDALFELVIYDKT